MNWNTKSLQIITECVFSITEEISGRLLPRAKCTTFWHYNLTQNDIKGIARKVCEELELNFLPDDDIQASTPHQLSSTIYLYQL